MMAEAKPATLAEAFVQAQSAMETPKRTAENPHFTSRFAPLAEVIACSVPALNAHGIALVQPTVSTDDGRIGVHTLLIGYGETMDLGTLLGTPPADPQKVGSWLTYFRRYALSSALALAAEDDDDGNAASGLTAPKTSGALATDKQVSLIFALGRDLGWDDDKTIASVAKSTGKAHPGDLSKSDASKLIDSLTAMTKAAKGKVEAAAAELSASDDGDHSDTPIPF